MERGLSYEDLHKAIIDSTILGRHFCCRQDCLPKRRAFLYRIPKVCHRLDTSHTANLENRRQAARIEEVSNCACYSAGDDGHFHVQRYVLQRTQNNRGLPSFTYNCYLSGIHHNLLGIFLKREAQSGKRAWNCHLGMRSNSGHLKRKYKSDIRDWPGLGGTLHFLLCPELDSLLPDR